jgi:hypothetical protein
VKGLARVSDTEDLGQRGAWWFTREHVVEPELTLVFYNLYEAAFGPLRTRSIARQTLTEDEFTAQMVNGAVSKYVAWDADGNPVGMCTLTQQLDTVPWISPEYFAARYPEHWARRAIWYFGFILAHPSQRHSRFLDQMVEVGVGELAEQGAICAYDICAYNDEMLGLGRRLSESFQRTTGVAATRTDTQNYYEVDFS